MRRLSDAITDGLLLWAPLAAMLGVIFDRAGQRAIGLTPWLLAVMVFATGFTVPPARLVEVMRRPERLLVVLALQFGPLSLLALLLAHLPLGEATSTGMLVLGVAPSEVTAGLMVLLAAGDTALGTAIVGASLLASSLVAPWLLSVYAAGSVFVDRAALLQELTLCVGLPLIAASSLRGMLAMRAARTRTTASLALFDESASRSAPATGMIQPESAPVGDRSTDDMTAALFGRPPADRPEAMVGSKVERLISALTAGTIATLDRYLPALAALAVLALLGIVAGTARSLLLTPAILGIAALCLLMNVAGYVAGWLSFRLLGAPERAVRAAVFTTGMREFGVAATIATAILPTAAGVAGVYGMVILFTAPALVRLWARQDRGGAPAA